MSTWFIFERSALRPVHLADLGIIQTSLGAPLKFHARQIRLASTHIPLRVHLARLVATAEASKSELQVQRQTTMSKRIHGLPLVKQLNAPSNPLDTSSVIWSRAAAVSTGRTKGVNPLQMAGTVVSSPISIMSEPPKDEKYEHEEPEASQI
ncbi:hypothetical protein C0991_009556, partial [Blastosporella zonata]